MDTEWMANGNCASEPPSLFFPSDGVGVEVARRICATCPVKEQCLEHALVNRIDHGVWGGASERERRRILKRRRTAQPSAGRATDTPIAAGTLRGGRRTGRSGLVGGRRLVVVGAGVAFLDATLELALGRAHRASQLGQLGPAEQDEDHQQDDEKFRCSEVHAGHCIGRGLRNPFGT